MNKKTSFIPETLTIKTLFLNNAYTIPDYQRLYAWSDDQIYKLWDDIYEAYQNKSLVENYFLGSIITVSGSGRGREDIVDGQQRITTLTILFATICKMFDKLEYLENSYGEDAVTIDTVKRLYLNEGANIKLKLQKQLHLDTDFNNFILDSLPALVDDENFKKPKPAELRNGTQRKKYENALFIFRQKLSEIKSEISEFVNFLLNDVLVIKVSCSELLFAIKLFQIINDRGLDLTTADIVKSYLLGRVNEQENKEDYDKVSNNWQNTVTLTETLHSADMSNYLNYYIHYLLNATPKVGVANIVEDILKCQGDKEKLKKIVSMEKCAKEVVSVVDFTQNLYNFVQHYKEVYNSNNKAIYALTLLPWDTVWVPLLSVTHASSYRKEDKETLYNKFLRFFYINYISNRTYNQIKQTALNLLKSLKEQREINEIYNDIDKEITDELLLTFKLNLTSADVFSEKWIKNVLVLIEYYERDAKERLIIDKDMHIEHILPVKWETNSNGEWNHITQKVSTEKLYSLGNLTLLNYKKNILATNDGYTTKIAIYKGEDPRIKDQGKTAYSITQKIITDYDNSKVTTWDETSINARASYLTEKLLKILNVSQEKFDNLKLA